MQLLRCFRMVLARCYVVSRALWVVAIAMSMPNLCLHVQHSCKKSVVQLPVHCGLLLTGATAPKRLCLLCTFSQKVVGTPHFYRLSDENHESNYQKSNITRMFCD